jgi:hypothetical protein
VPARQFNLVIEQGASYTIAVPALNANNSETNVDGWQGAGQIRARATSGTTIADLDVTPEGTEVVLHIPHTVSSGWNFRTARYDVELTSPDGLIVTRFLEGFVIVNPEVTR